MSKIQNLKSNPYILMLPRWYPNIKDNADGNFIESHINCISSKFKTCVLFVKGMESTYSSEDIARKSNQNILNFIQYFNLSKGPLKSIINPIRFFLVQLNTYKELKSIHGKPSLIHVHVMGRNALLAYYLKIFEGVDYAISEHWSGYYEETNKIGFLKKIFFKIMYSKASVVTAVSESLASAIKNVIGVKNIRIIPNVLDRVFLTTPFKSGPSTKKQLIHISNLNIEIKQVDKIIQYLDELAAARDDFELMIIGDGHDKGKLVEYSKKFLHLQNRLNFTGDISPEELADYIATASATLSFSKYETQSIVLLESIAMGVPVVAPSVGGIPEHCTDKGFLFLKNSKDEFISAVEKILNEDVDLNKSQMREYAISHFSSEVIFHQFASVYSSIIPTLNVQ